MEILETPTKNHPKSLPGALGATEGDSGGFGGAPGTLREALGELSGRPWSASGRHWTPRSDRKVRLGGPESTFVSVLFGQSLARRSQSDFRTILGSVAEGATRNPIAMAHTDCMSGVFRLNAWSTTKSFENWYKHGPPIAPKVVSGDRGKPREPKEDQGGAKGDPRGAKGGPRGPREIQGGHPRSQACEASSRNILIDIYILVSLRANARGGSNEKKVPTRSNLREV